MALEFEFLSATDKPALVATSDPERLALCKTILQELDYKIHVIEDHPEFPARFAEVQYHVLIIDETFAQGSSIHNPTLQLLQRMPMNQRRHVAIILLNGSCETLNGMQAFQKSVHAVVNYEQVILLGQIIPKIVSDNNLFLNSFREVQQQIARSRA